MNPVTIADVEIIHAQHAADLAAANRKLEWLERITAPQEIDSLLTAADRDEIDEACEIDPLLFDRPIQRRSNAQTSRLLDILDELHCKEGWGE